MPAEQVAQAQALLLSLTAPWHVGPGDAERLAPLLAAVAAERGWSFGEELRRQLMSNPGGGSNYLWLLEHKRIAALPVRTTRKAAVPRTAQPGMCARHPGFREGDCSACVKAARAASRAAAAGTDPTPDTHRRPSAGDREPGTAQDSSVGEGVSAELVAYVQGLAEGAAADNAARRQRPVLTRPERERLAEEQEQARRHEAHNHVLNA